MFQSIKQFSFSHVSSIQKTVISSCQCSVYVAQWWNFSFWLAQNCNHCIIFLIWFQSLFEWWQMCHGQVVYMLASAMGVENVSAIQRLWFWSYIPTHEPIHSKETNLRKPTMHLSHMQQCTILIQNWIMHVETLFTLPGHQHPWYSL